MPKGLEKEELFAEYASLKTASSLIMKAVTVGAHLGAGPFMVLVL
jgi:hypothetical protein